MKIDNPFKSTPHTPDISPSAQWESIRGCADSGRGIHLLPAAMRMRKLLISGTFDFIAGIRPDADIAYLFTSTARGLQTEQLFDTLDGASAPKVLENGAYYKAILAELCRRFQIVIKAT